MITEVIARLKSRVPDFGNRIEGAMELADLMARKALPQVTPAAHVVPLGMQGGVANSANMFFTQEFDETIGVLITLRTFTATGGKSSDLLETLKLAVISALAGWAPDTAVGVFRLLRGQMVSMEAGTLVYQIDFALMDQLRITP
jgi:hypothetical protein